MYKTEQKKLRQTQRSNNIYKRQNQPFMSPRQNYQDTKSSFSSKNKLSSFRVSAQNLFSIITKIKEQNQFFQSQREKISQQIAKLNSLSEIIAKQNQDLSNHYQQRTVDLQKIISSFIINAQEDISDLNHLIFTCRQHNELINKNLVYLLDQQDAVQNLLFVLIKEHSEIKAKNIELQKLLQARQIKYKQNDTVINKKKQPTKYAWTLESLQKEVCDLEIDIFGIKRKNLELVKLLKKQKDKLYQKPTIKEKVIKMIKQSKPLVQQIQMIRFKTEQQQSQLNDLNSRNQAVLKKISQMQQLNQAKRLKIGRVADKNRCKNQQINKTKYKICQLEQIKQQKMKIKQNLEKQIQKQEEIINLNHSHHQSRKQQIQLETEAKIQIIKQEIQETRKMRKQQLNQIFLVNKQNSIKISDSKYELQFLQSRASQLQKNIQTSRNLFKHIRLTQLNIIRNYK